MNHILTVSRFLQQEITRRTTGARGYKFELLKSNFQLYQTIFLVYIVLSQLISVYFGISWSISVHLSAFWSISVYLGLTHSISEYTGLSGTILDYHELSGTIWDLLGLSRRPRPLKGVYFLELKPTQFFFMVNNYLGSLILKFYYYRSFR